MTDIYVVDAFADGPFSGNPAAVVLLDEPRSDAWMQAVAAEMLHSETAFVDMSVEPKGLRWFTPTDEVDLCGHATLAAAWVLGVSQQFATRSGLLSCELADGWVSMSFPLDPFAEEFSAADLFDVDVQRAWLTQSNRVVALTNEENVRHCRPNLDRMLTTGRRGFVITARGSRADTVTRYFAPIVGVNEDAVTGNAHCAIAAHWSVALGKSELVGYQASPRGGIVRMRVSKDGVVLSGKAVTMLKGRLHT